MKRFGVFLSPFGFGTKDKGDYILYADHLDALAEKIKSAQISSLDEQIALHHRWQNRISDAFKQIAALEAAVKEKDAIISRLRDDLCDRTIAWENACILLKERQEQIAALTDEISIQDQMLHPGDSIHERTVDEVDICVLRKDLWDIKSLKEAAAIREQIAALKAELELVQGRYEDLLKIEGLL